MGAINLLRQLSLLQAAPRPYEGTLVLGEHQEIAAKLDSLPSADVVASIQKMFGRPILSRLIQASFRLDAAGRPELCLSASSVVGFGALEEEGRRVFLSIQPKVSGARLLELAFLADRLPAWRPDILVGEDPSSALVEWTLRSYIHSVRQLLARGGLRATHERIQADLPNRVRGRLLISPLVKSLAAGRPDRIRCEYASLQLDNTYNRLLRWALHVGSLTLGVIPKLGSLRDEYRATERAFGGVPLMEPNLQDLTRSIVPSNLSHYRDSLRLAQALLRQCSLQTEAGSSTSVAVALDMNDLYQRAFFNLIKKMEPTAASGPHWKVSLTSADRNVPQRSTTMIPDVFVSGTDSSCPTILDTKWKDVFPAITSQRMLPENFDAGGARLNSSDLYQITAYAVECLRRSGAQTRNACVAALVYPAMSPMPDMGYDIEIGNLRIMLRLAAWDLSYSAEAGVRALWNRLRLCREANGRPGSYLQPSLEKS